jgi:Tol biopolymer transport system component
VQGLHCDLIDVGVKQLEFLTNEAIEGEPLADRLAKGGLPAQAALRYAVDIGTALKRAHNGGAVHGKLSPRAILLTASGARIARPVEGVDLDALAYRSPEQVFGEAPGWRSDIFAFGALLYEMVSGRRAFPGEGAALGRAIVEQSPAPLQGKSSIHAAMEGVIAGCIEKDPARRRQRVQNAVLELRLAARLLPRLPKEPTPPKVEPERPAETAASVSDPSDIRPSRPRIFTPVLFPDEIQAVPGKARRQRMMLWVVLLCVAIPLAVSGGWIVSRLYRTPPPPVVRFPISPPPAVSPDGRFVVGRSDGPEGKPMLWLRPLDTLKPRVIPGTEGGFAPFWSPDSQSVAFFADKALRKVRIADGHTERICDAEILAGGGAWNRSGTILFAPGHDTTLFQVSAKGGVARPVQPLNAARFERAHIWPQFLPDGNHFVFFVLSDSPGAMGVYAGSLASPDATMLFPSDTNAIYSPPAPSDSGKHGYLLFIRGRSLMGVGFDAGHLTVLGEPIVLREDVGAVESLSLAPVSVSDTAMLVYQSVGPASRRLSWTDRAGKALASVSEGGNWGPVRISPEGARAIVERKTQDGKHSQLWLVDRGGHITQFTNGASGKGSPVWSPDGSRIACYSEMDGNYDLVSGSAEPGSQMETLLSNPLPKFPTDWSRDGKYLLFGLLTEATKSDIWALSMADRHTAPVLDTISSEGYAALSPDGKWMAYQSDESGRNQVYVQPFDGIAGGTRRRYDVSTEGGGGLPRWRADGQELFYLTASGRMMAVRVYLQGDEFRNDPPQALFQTLTTPNTWNWFDVAPDGQRFLMSLPLEWSNASPIAVVTNWTPKVKD